MAFVDIVVDALGNAGNTVSRPVEAGPTFINVRGDDFTGVTVKMQFSEDGTNFFDIDGLSTSVAKSWIVTLPAGHLRANIAGGGAGDNIDIRFHQSAFRSVRTTQTITRTNP